MRVYKLFTKIEYTEDDYHIYHEYHLFEDYKSKTGFHQLNSLDKIGYYLGEPGFDMIDCIILDIDFKGFSGEILSHRDFIVSSLRNNNINNILDETI